MNPDVARMWADALDSGDYEQTRGALSRVNSETGEKSYCCLGVLCELAINAGVPIKVEPSIDDNRLYYDGTGGRLPNAVQEWAECDDDPDLGHETAVHLNDSFGWQFPEIANAIRFTFIPKEETP